jgi:hypothetical protein
MNVILTKYRYYILLVIIDILFFGLFSPRESSFVIMPAFILVLLTTYALTVLVSKYFARIFPIKEGARKRFVLITTCFLGLLIALQSVGQLTFRDLLTLIPLIAVLYFYLSYLRSRQS